MRCLSVFPGNHVHLWSVDCRNFIPFVIQHPSDEAIGNKASMKLEAYHDWGVPKASPGCNAKHHKYSSAVQAKIPKRKVPPRMYLRSH